MIFLSQEIAGYFSHEVARFFLVPETLHDFFGPEKLHDFFGRESLRDFFLAKEVA